MARLKAALGNSPYGDMPIANHTQLGPYEVIAPLGSGGMGEVYLAEDTRLHRRVALKILPAELASDRNRMNRFNQEAMAAAALNHPHIAHIYEIGAAGGVQAPGLIGTGASRRYATAATRITATPSPTRFLRDIKG